MKIFSLDNDNTDELGKYKTKLLESMRATVKSVSGTGFLSYQDADGNKITTPKALLAAQEALQKSENFAILVKGALTYLTADCSDYYGIIENTITRVCAASNVKVPFRSPVLYPASYDSLVSFNKDIMSIRNEKSPKQIARNYERALTTYSNCKNATTTYLIFEAMVRFLTSIAETMINVLKSDRVPIIKSEKDFTLDKEKAIRQLILYGLYLENLLAQHEKKRPKPPLIANDAVIQINNRSNQA